MPGVCELRIAVAAPSGRRGVMPSRLWRTKAGKRDLKWLVVVVVVTLLLVAIATVLLVPPAVRLGMRAFCTLMFNSCD